MREILFRGQTRRKGERTINVAGDKCDSNWVYGGIFPQNKGGDFAIIYQQDPDIQKFTVYADTVGQFTGRTDRNGNKIFEGDIVQAALDGRYYSVEYIADDEYAFNFVDLEKGYTYSLYDFNDIIVIGNIYDNPELLEGGDEE